MTDEQGMRAGERLTDAIKSVAAADPDYEGSVLTGFVLVAEYLRPDGRRMLGYVTRDGSGRNELTDWGAGAFVHAAELHFDGRIVNSQMPPEEP